MPRRRYQEEEPGRYDEVEGFSEEEGLEEGRGRGFAAMPKEKVRAIASKGGKSSRGSRIGGKRRYEESESEGSEEGLEEEERQRGRKKGRRGFAAMPKERVREIARMGGKARGGSDIEEEEEEEEEGEEEEEEEGEEEEGGFEEEGRGRRYGRRGFAAMPKERVREIARMGGRRSHIRESDLEEGEEGYEGRRYGKRGFAAMPKERVREISRLGRERGGGFQYMDKERLRTIASKGGKRSHGGYGRYEEGEESEEGISEEEPLRGQKYGKRGFAAMPREKVRAIASKGGRSSHGYSY